jgi:tetratricopeptide (TPR) repeat protein
MSLYDEAEKAWANRDLHAAKKLAERFLGICPSHAGALMLLGICEAELDNEGVALHLMLAAINHGAKDAQSYANLGGLFSRLRLEKPAQEALTKALEIDPNNLMALANMAGTFVNEGNPEPGIAWADKILAAAPSDPGGHGHWNRALLLLESGRWGEGWDEYAIGLKTGRRVGYRAYPGTPDWDGAPGKTVVFYGEQGVGDEIMTASMLPDARKLCEDVILDCHPRLVASWKRSFPWLKGVYGTRKDKVINWHTATHFDASFALADLGGLVRRKAEDFPKKPYLKPDPERVKLWRKRLGPGPHWGIHWRGGKRNTNYHYRSLDLEALKPILEMPVAWHSLQHNNTLASAAENRDERRAFEAKHGIWIDHRDDVVDDYEETIAFTAALDGVVSVCTTLVHTCGALGKTCLVLAPKGIAWRYGLSGEEMPWYGPWVRMFRQKGHFEWDKVIGDIRDELEDRITAPDRMMERVA